MHRSKRFKPILLFYLKIHNGWESKKSMKFTGTLLLACYLFLLVTVTLKQYGYLPDNMRLIPDNPYKAIEFAFTLLLFFEVINLVFAIEKSFSGSMQIQLEIFSLILLRSAFKKFGVFQGTLSISEFNENILHMFTDAGAALLIFIGIIMIKLWDKPLPYHMDISKIRRFINIKRFLALVLLVIFSVLTVIDVFFLFCYQEVFDFFHEFYTVMIFVDIMIVFVSLRYSTSYFILFRNSCYALATVIIRLALSTEEPYNAILGILATIFVLGITLTYNKINRLGII